MTAMVIKKCSCVHSQMDQKLGLNKRWHNPTKKNKEGGPIVYRCTVCGAERT